MKRALRRAGLFVLAGGVTAVLVGPFLIPVPPLKGTFPPRQLADDDSEFIEINGLDIHVKSMGQGEPVFVLLHGFAASLYSWRAVMEPLSQLGTVIAFDRPGFGLSEHPLTWHGQNPYSQEAQVELVTGLLDHFGVKNAILVGNSAGGTVSMQVALAHPERVSALILVDPAVYIGRRTPGWLHYLFDSPQMRHMGPLLSRQILKHGQDLIKLAWHDPSKLPVDMLEYYQKPFQVENWDKTLWEFTLASRPTGLTECLDEFTLPILVITGDDDRIVPTEDSIRLAGELPNASLEVIFQAGHIPHEEKPKEFIEAVTNFLYKLQS
jgi:pimeloyl-ACP methyl ester carboxylesterase